MNHETAPSEKQMLAFYKDLMNLLHNMHPVIKGNPKSPCVNKLLRSMCKVFNSLEEKSDMCLRYRLDESRKTMNKMYKPKAKNAKRK